MTTATPEPPRSPLAGHLWQWAVDPLPLLEAGAKAGPVFRLRLWRPALVGYRPDWNRAILSDLDTFRSRGSLSGLTPYLAAGVVQTDAPAHRARRRWLSGHFSSRALAPLSAGLAAAADEHPPQGSFRGARLVQPGRPAGRPAHA